MAHQSRRFSRSFTLSAITGVALAALAMACGSGRGESSASDSARVDEETPVNPDTPPVTPTTPGSACVFDCTTWSPSDFGGARSPALFQYLVSQESAVIGAVGRRGADGACVPDAIPEKTRSLFTSGIPSFMGSANTSDQGVEAKSQVTDYGVAEGALRYACMSDGRVFRRADVEAGTMPETSEEDLQSFFEQDCVSSGLCTATDIHNDAALAAAGSGTNSGGASGELPVVPAGPDDSGNMAIHLAQRLKRASNANGGLMTSNWNPNNHVPVGFLGRRIVARITESPCTAFNGLDRTVRKTDNRWGVYASFGGGAGLRLSAAYFWDLTNAESAAYLDGSVIVGFSASVGVGMARGISIGGGNATYSSIHNFYGGVYFGAAISVPTPFTVGVAGVNVGGQISTQQPLHPWSLELNVSFGVGSPFSAGATVGQIGPINVGTRTLRGITQGLVNVFDDEYGSVGFDGVPVAITAGDYERMRNSPGSSGIWQAGNMANSAVRFANAHDLAALFVFRSAFSYAWDRMRRACN